ncbi:MAG: hypothetical protein ACLUW6_10485 [Coriobacteriaceae bacterium]
MPKPFTRTIWSFWQPSGMATAPSRPRRSVDLDVAPSAACTMKLRAAVQVVAVALEELVGGDAHGDSGAGRRTLHACR